MLDRERIGTNADPMVYDVEAGAIRRFAEAIGDSNPIHHDPKEARRAGFAGLVAPPTFPLTFQADSNEMAGLDMTETGVLLGEQAFEIERPMVAGDRISVVRRVEEMGEKDGGSGVMDFYSVLEEGTNQDGELVYRGRRVIIVRKS